MQKTMKFIFYIFLIIFGLFSKANGEKIDLKKIIFLDINGEEFSLNNISSNILL